MGKSLVILRTVSPSGRLLSRQGFGFPPSQCPPCLRLASLEAEYKTNTAMYDLLMEFSGEKENKVSKTGQ